MNELQLRLSVPGEYGSSEEPKGVEAVRILGDDQYVRFFCHGLDDGVHGKVVIYLNRFRLGHDNFNLERNDPRRGLANHAHSVLRPPISDAYSKELLRHDLDTFAFKAYHTWLGVNESQMISGDPQMPISHVIEPWAPVDGGTIIYARPGSAKSYTALTAAICVDAGLSTFWPVSQRNVLYVNLERSEASLTRRVGCVNVALGLDPHRPLRFLNRRGYSLNDVVASVRTDMDKHDIGWIVLDSISRAGMGDLNENRPATRIIDALNTLIEKPGRGWLAIGHTGWESKHIFGSVHFEGGADVMVAITSARNDENELGVRFRITKSNDIEPSTIPILAMSFNEQGVDHIRSARLSEFPDLRTEGQKAEDAVVSYLGEVNSATIAQMARDLDIPYPTVQSSITRARDGMFRKHSSGQYSLVKKPTKWG